MFCYFVLHPISHCFQHGLVKVSSGTRLFNALFLSNLCEYHRKSYTPPKAKSFLYLRQYRSNFRKYNIDVFGFHISRIRWNDAK